MDPEKATSIFSAKDAEGAPEKWELMDVTFSIFRFLQDERRVQGDRTGTQLVYLTTIKRT